MANIRWTATASNPEWMTLSAGTQVGFSITGEGDTYINITGNPTSPGESSETGTVEFRGMDDDSLVKVIEVQRCGSGCGCDTFRTKALPENNRVGFNFDDDSDVKKTLLDLNNCVEENDVMFLNLNELEPYFNFDFSPVNSEWTVSPKSDNPEETISKTLKVKYGSCDVSTIEIYQNANDCGCGNIHYGEEYVWTWDKKLVNGINVGGLEETIASFDDCVEMDDVTIAPDLSTLADFNVTLNNKILVASPKNNNDAAGAVQLVNTVKIDYLNCAQKTINLKQNNRGAYYLHFLTSDNQTSDTVSGDGGKKTLKYFVSASEDDNSAPFVGTDFVECQFAAPQIEGVTTGNTALTNGIYTVEVTFARNSTTQDKPVTFTATCPTAAVTAKTVTLTQSGSEALYVHINCESGPVMREGGEKHFEYYVSPSQEDDKTKAIDVACTFQCPTGIQSCGTEARTIDFINTRTVKFSRNDGETGLDWEFSATCEIATEQTVKKVVHQACKYDNVIPNCDYFIFRYRWDDEHDTQEESVNGTDLDSLTHISTVPSLSGLTVGYAGTAPSVYNDGVKMNIVSGVNGQPLLKFGGDNRCNGSEYTIICIKNLLEDGSKNGYISQDDVVYIDVYANWFSFKRQGNMRMLYDQYTGTTGVYADEITEYEIKKTDPSSQGGCWAANYFTFKPKSDSVCKKIGNTVEKGPIYINAHGGNNATFSENVDCLNKLYSHAFRFIYDVGKAETRLLTIDQLEDEPTKEGLDDKEKKLVYSNVIIDGVSKGGGEYYNIYTIENVDIGSHTVKYENVYFKHFVNDTTYTLNVLNSDDSYIKILEYKNGQSQASNYYYKNDLGSSKDYTFVKGFKVTKNSNGTVNIEYNMDGDAIYRKVELEVHENNRYYIPCSGKLYKIGEINLREKNNNA